MKTLHWKLIKEKIILKTYYNYETKKSQKFIYFGGKLTKKKVSRKVIKQK